MSKLPEQPADSLTVQAVYADYATRQESVPRRSIGGSTIGHPCDRHIWLKFRWADHETHIGRMIRLFQTGQLEEIRIVDNLTRIGCTVMAVDETTGEQIEYTAVGGHFRIHLDGVVLGLPEAPKTWHNCEFKTHNAKSFAALKNQGLIASKPAHYVQLLVGMRLAGLTRGLYWATNKDTDEVYTERLRIEEHRDAADAILDRAHRLISDPKPPTRLPQSDWNCKYCHHAPICHGEATPQVNCRTCVHSTPIIDDSDDGLWRCEKKGRAITEQEQRAGCEDHLFIPDLLNWASVVDGGCSDDGDWIEYSSRDGGKIWRNGKQKGQYRSVELRVLKPSEVGAGLVDAVKGAIGGEVVGVEPIEPETPKMEYINQGWVESTDRTTGIADKSPDFLALGVPCKWCGANGVCACCQTCGDVGGSHKPNCRTLSQAADSGPGWKAEYKERNGVVNREVVLK